MPTGYTEFETRSRIYGGHSRPLGTLSSQELQNLVGLYERGIIRAQTVLDAFGFDPNHLIEGRQTEFQTEYMNTPYEPEPRATPEEIARVQEQLAQTMNDPNLSIVTSFNFPLDENQMNAARRDIASANQEREQRNIEMEQDMRAMHGVYISRERMATRARQSIQTEEDQRIFDSINAIQNFNYSRATPSDREILRRSNIDYDLPGGRSRWFKYFDKCKMKEVEENLPKDSIGWLEI